MCYHTVFDNVTISITSSFNYKANRKYNSTITLRPLGHSTRYYSLFRVMIKGKTNILSLMVNIKRELHLPMVIYFICCL